jgi:hypothetical protein
MRLLNVQSMKLVNFTGAVPKYAILSHTWTNDELTLQEMLGLTAEIKKKSGYDKIVQCSRICCERKMTYVWIDTICIDKSSSAELSEGINSMWRWYREAAVCYVYLEDFHAPSRVCRYDLPKHNQVTENQRLLPQEVFSFGLELNDDLSEENEDLIAFDNALDSFAPSRTVKHAPTRDGLSTRLSLKRQWRKSLGESRWFSRGWTLQELIAPHNMIFFTKEWEEFDTKARLISDLSKITQISEVVLQTGRLETVSIAQRLSWAAKRETTRIEDMAYCLLGILDVNMPLLYGEGVKAFQRLQEEVIKASSDLSIFAWQDQLHDPRTMEQHLYRGLLARHPRDFALCKQMQPSQGSTISSPYMVTNHGLSLRLRLFKEDEQVQIYIADLQIRQTNSKFDMFELGEDTVGIYLKRLSREGDQFVRIWADRFVSFPSPEKVKWNNLVVQREQIFVRQTIIIPEDDPTTTLSTFLLDVEPSNLDPSLHPLPKSCAKRFADCGIRPYILSSSVEFVEPSTLHIITPSNELSRAALQLSVPVDLSIACFIIVLGYTKHEGAWWEMVPASNRFVDDQTMEDLVHSIRGGSTSSRYRKRLSSDLEVVLNVKKEVHQDRLAIRIKISPKIKPREISCRIDIIV